jgi:peptidoglycan hydrolase CwlO-like protein
MDNIFITFITSTITGIITFFVGVQRSKKEVEGLSLQNLEKSIEVYNIIIQDLKGQLSELLEKVDNLEKKIDELVKENDELKRMLKEHDKRQRDKDNANT